MIHIHGAYGRKYNTPDAAKKDWDAGKDFKIFGGPYCSIRDKDSMIESFKSILIYYGPNFEHYFILED